MDYSKITFSAHLACFKSLGLVALESRKWTARLPISARVKAGTGVSSLCGQRPFQGAEWGRLRLLTVHGDLDSPHPGAATSLEALHS